MTGLASLKDFSREKDWEKPPRERLVTMPPTLPELTLGYWVIAWIEDNLRQPNGPRRGKRVQLLPSQAEYLLHLYAVDEEGHWIYNRAARRRAKGTGKSPFAAMQSLAELLGPTKFLDFDPRAPGGVIGEPVAMPLVNVAATSEDQTANTIRMVRAMANKNTTLAKKYSLQPMKTFIETPDGGILKQITSSATSAEGGELTAAIADETEHWTPNVGGKDLAETLDQNLTKTGGRLQETCNAWIPGVDSVAESTFDAWVLQEEGRTRADAQRILYDARIAPPDVDLTDGEQLMEALEFVYDDAYFANLNATKNKIWSPTYPVSRSRRFFLNQPNAAEDAWITLQEWSVMADPERELVPGEDIVLFFDGSKSNDHTALIGCCMSDGHIFTAGIWEPRGEPAQIDAQAVDSGVHKMHEFYNVVAFWADVREFESYVKTSWPEKWGDEYLVPAQKTGTAASPTAWDMRSHALEFARAAETCKTEIEDGKFTHDGNWTTSRHMGNARAVESKGHVTVKKESPKSPNKIDAAVCVIGARMLYRIVKASPEWEKYANRGDFVFFT